mmetsp:Transcript_16238/g.47347  ORF Transcript_16238/g.47347 Transcript_16238/m.47347 type:complete len:334 (+) Transcript_16238:32-1033(+)
MNLRVVFCDVDSPPRSQSILVRADPSDTVFHLQKTLAALRPELAPHGAERVRLFAPAADRPAVGAAVPTLVLCTRPQQTLQDAGITDIADLTLYWASDLMTFQDGYAELLPRCDPRVAAAAQAAAGAARAAKAAARSNERRAFWAMAPGPWPFEAESVAFYWSHSNSYGEGEMGDSTSLSLRRDGTFRMHDHHWSDTGRKSRHSHNLRKGAFRLVPRRAPPAEDAPDDVVGSACCMPGARSAVAVADVVGKQGAQIGASFALHMMPTHSWSSHHIPPRWEDEAAFTALPKERTDPLDVAQLHLAPAEAPVVTISDRRLTGPRDSRQPREHRRL